MTSRPADDTAAATATNRHYDLPPEVFGTFLGRTLKYSSALYTREDMSLDEAQAAKLHFIAAQLGARPGARVLDVGCGWGSLTLFLAAEYRCQVTGLTPAANQRDYVLEQAASRGLASLVSVTNAPVLDADLGTSRYDAAAMVGSLVHVIDKPAAVRKVYRHLRRGGRLYLSDTYWRNQAVRAEFADQPSDNFIKYDYFGFGDIVLFSAVVAAVEEAGFSLAGLTDLTADYVRTIADWEQRATESAAQIDRISPGSADKIIQFTKLAAAGHGLTTKHYALSAVKDRLGTRGDVP